MDELDNTGLNMERQSRYKLIGIQLNRETDQELLRLWEIVKSVGGIKTKRIFEMGLKAYLQSEDFKDKSQIIQRLSSVQ